MKLRSVEDHARLLLLASVAFVACFATTAAVARGATTVRVEGRALVVTGSEGADRVSVGVTGAQDAYVVSDPAGVQAGTDCVVVDAATARCARAIAQGCTSEGCRVPGAEALRVTMAGGDDTALIGYGAAAQGWPDDRAIVDGGEGDDLIGGTPLDDELSGGSGADRVDGSRGRDRLSGGGGRDRLFGGVGADELRDGDRLSEPGPDLLDGGPCREDWCVPDPGGETDTDAVSYADRREAVSVDLRSPGAVQGQAGEGDVVRGVEDATGGAGPDRLVAASRASALRGGAGDDELTARNGVYDPTLECGPGIDTVRADAADRPTGCEREDRPGSRVPALVAARREGSRLTVSLRCPAGGSRCAATASLATARRRVAVGRFRYDLAAGRSAVRRVRLRPRARRLLAGRRPSLRVVHAFPTGGPVVRLVTVRTG